jgi:molybdopterin/thiamine biosynthesis adenylyltransferase
MIGYDYLDIIQRNIGVITKEDQEKLSKITIGLAGVGAIGSLAGKLAARLGVKSIICIDRDVYDVSNLNRQMNARLDTIDVQKSVAAKKLYEEINPNVKVISHVADCKTVEQTAELLKGSDYVITGIDNTAGRIIFARACRQLGIPNIVGGPIGWKMLVGTFMPDGITYEQFVTPIADGKELDFDMQKRLEILQSIFFACCNCFNPDFVEDHLRGKPFTAVTWIPNMIACYSIAEIVKLELGRGETFITPKTFAIDTLSGKFWNVKEKGEAAMKVMMVFEKEGREAAIKYWKENVYNEGESVYGC